MPIAFAPEGKELEIKRVGAEEKVRKHLQEMGITVGGKIKLLSSAGGNVIILELDRFITHNEEGEVLLPPMKCSVVDIHPSEHAACKGIVELLCLEQIPIEIL